MRRLLVSLAAVISLAAPALASPTFSRLAPSATLRAPATPLSTTSGPWSSPATTARPGRTRTVATDPTRGQLFVGADEAGYWRGGLEPDLFTPWLPFADQLGGGVLHMVTAYAPPSFVVERHVVVRSRDQALLYSDDFGSSWTPCTLPNGFQISKVRRLISDGATDEVKYLVAFGYDPVNDWDTWLVARSVDAGATWTTIRENGRTAPLDLWSARYGGSRLVLAEDNENDIVVEESTDQGLSWSPVTTLAFQGGQLDLTVAASEATPAKVWMVLTSDLWLWDGVAESTLGTISIEHGTLTASALTPDFLMWCSAPNTYWSDDGGTTVNAFPNSNWLGDATHINPQPTNVQSVITFYTPTDPTRAARLAPHAPTGNLVPLERFYISTGSGTYIYMAGFPNTELLTVSEIGNQQVRDVSSLNVGPTWAMYLGLRDLGMLELVGNTIPVPVVGGVSTTPNDVGTVATNRRPAGSNPYRLIQFTGGHVAVVGPGEFASTALPDGGLPDAFHTLIADPTAVARWYWCADRIVQVDYDAVTDAFTQSGIGPAFVGLFTGLAAAPSNAQIRYAVTTGTGGGPLVFRTTNNWTTWTQQAGPGVNTPAGEPGMVSVAVHPTNANEVLIAGATVLRCTDGSNFAPFAAGLPAGARIYEVIWAGSPPTPWAATSDGAFRHNGTAWVEESTPTFGVPDVPFRSAEYLSWSNRIRFGTYGRGVYEYQLGSTSDADDPRTASLALAARTNPVRERATLAWALPEAGPATLEVLDVTGRRVAKLASGWHDAGTHEASFDARGLGAGVYFARLTARGESRNVRLVVTH